VQSQLRGRLAAATLALVAAFLWSTYYLFVLAVSPAARPSAVLFYPFLGGGVAYALWVVGHGNGRRLGAAFAQARAYLRVGLLLGMQLSVLAATYLTGPVDASLLSLLGDVVATPVVVAALFREHRGELGSPLLVAGLLLSLAGGTLAIVGGHGLSAVHDLSWAVVVVVPVTVAFFFVLSARAGTGAPVSVVVGQSMIAAAVVSAALAPLLPGGPEGLVEIGARPLLLLLANGLASFFVAPLLYFRSIERAGLVFPPMLMTGIPVFTLLLSAALLGIAPAFLALLGVPVAAAGGIVALAAGAREPTHT
jgi:drug/metabolite transporter (DMT)-like permease